MLSIKHLNKSFRRNQVLKDVNLEVHNGEAVGIIGPARAGKSLLLRCINRLECPDSGEILLDGDNILARGTDVVALRRKVGMVNQEAALFPALNVLENVMLAPRIVVGKSREQAQLEAADILQKIGLTAKSECYSEQLTNGQRLRAAIARALSLQPQLLLLDIPALLLDNAVVSEIIGVLNMLSDNNIALLIVTQQMRILRAVCSRVVFMDCGAIVEAGATADVLDNPRHPATRAFVQRLVKFVAVAQKNNFDWFQFNAEVENYALGRRFDTCSCANSLLVLEKLLMDLLLPKVAKIHIEIFIPESAEYADMFIRWQGETRNPLESENTEQGASKATVCELCPVRDFAVEDGNVSNLHLRLPRAQ